jgi:hypothetical protein
MLVLHKSLRNPAYYRFVPQWLLDVGRRTNRRIRAATTLLLHHSPLSSGKRRNLGR